MTNSTQRPIGVLGATGQQGGAVVDALLAAGAPVRAVVRDPDSDASRALAGRGVEVVRGDQDDPDTMREPFIGLSAAYLMFTFSDESGTQGEVRRGTAVGDVAAAAGVPRVVYSSVGGAERHSGIPHFESKRRIEEHLESVVPVQFIRPAFFMDNLVGQLDQDGDEFVLRMAMPGDIPLQMIAVRDIGRIAARALLDAEALDSGALEIAGDQPTGDQAAEIIGRYLGKPGRYEQLPLNSLPDDDLKAMFGWFIETPSYEADFERTRALDPEVLDLAGWLATRG